jgi:arylsulfatase A-like enzyme
MSSQERRQPNLLLICVDHWPGQMLGAAGHPCLMTPTLDQLAANGVRYTNTYSATPTCIPARRGLMTGTSARTHGDRVFSETLPMPRLPTLAQTFSEAGYQSYAVGKLHVYPQRNRIGFHDVILNEEGRHHLGLAADDYELWLAAEGYAGQEYTHGMATTDYIARPWHLPEYLHPTNWTAREMCRIIRRRDPTRPAFWTMSFTAPHPPLVPLVDYLNMYRDVDIPDPYVGDWAGDFERLPYPLRQRHNNWYALLRYSDHRTGLSEPELRLARQAFYALCTHVDHQIRLVIGTLREEGLLDDTIVVFTSDHGDMLGNHGQFAKGLLYEDSAKVPLIIIPTAGYGQLSHHQVDDRLVELRDIMPTLLDLAGITIPESVDGISLLAAPRREYLYGEHDEGDMATRMVRSERYKMIYYPVGNRFHLFDLEEDPNELKDLSDDPAHSQIIEELTATLRGYLYGDDLGWVDHGRLIGLPDQEFEPKPNRGLTAQRGWRLI